MDDFMEALDPPRDQRAELAIDSVERNSQLTTSSLALYARWWQLETWLRELASLEFRTLHGANWADVVTASSWRQDRDARYTHMTGPDNENPLAYLDYSKLAELLNANWSLFSHTLIENSSWLGRQPELQQIRHRVAHMRRPAADDLGRVEQTLRDLERGAFIAISEYNNRWTPKQELEHPVVDGWISREHPTARRLINHAAQQYDTTLMVRRSVRPWGGELVDGVRTGVLWHADFFTGGRSLNVERFWEDILGSRTNDLLVQADISSWSVGLTFSNADDGDEISNAIGEAFDSVLTARSGLDPATWRARSSKYSDLDYRLKVDSAWNVVEHDTIPISIFDAGKGIEIRPRYKRGPGEK